MSKRYFHVDYFYTKDEINLVVLDDSSFPKDLNNVVILMISHDNIEIRFEIPEGRINSYEVYGFNVVEKSSSNNFDPTLYGKMRHLYVCSFEDSFKSVHIKLVGFSLNDINVDTIEAFEVKSDE